MVFTRVWWLVCGPDVPRGDGLKPGLLHHWEVTDNRRLTAVPKARPFHIVSMSGVGSKGIPRSVKV